MFWTRFQALKCTVGLQVTECSSSHGLSNTDIHDLIKQERSPGLGSAEPAGSSALKCYQEHRPCHPPALLCLCVSGVSPSDGDIIVPGSQVASQCPKTEAGGSGTFTSLFLLGKTLLPRSFQLTSFYMPSLIPGHMPVPAQITADWNVMAIACCRGPGVAHRSRERQCHISIKSI